MISQKSEKTVNNRFIGGFEEEFDDKMAARVVYLNQETVCAFSDKGLTFISVKNVIPDSTVVTVPVEEEIKSIFYSDKYAGVVVENGVRQPPAAWMCIRLMESWPGPWTLTTIMPELKLTATGLSCIMRNRAGYTAWTAI